jgi:hypothetical protein
MTALEPTGAKKPRKMVVTVEDVGGGECIVTPRGALTIEISSVLMTIAALYCMRLSGCTFDQLVERLREEVDSGQDPFKDLEIDWGSSIN